MPEMNYDVDAIAKDKKMYPDTYLIGAIHGKGSLPPIIAMMAGQKRKELMTAMQGKQNVKQPTVKDRLAAELQPQPAPEEQMGLASLPAENMQGMGEEKMLAGGGIVAFSGLGESLVELNKQAKSDDDAKNEWLQNAKKNPPAPSTPSFLDTLPARLAAKRSATTDAAIAQANADAAAQDKAAGVTAPAGGVQFDPTAGNNPAFNKPGGIGTPPSKGPAQAGQPPAPQDSGIAAAYKDFMGRKDPFAGLGDTDEQHAAKIAEAKNQGLSSFLMNMGAKIMSTTGPLGKAGGEGIAAGMPALENSHKVVRELDNAREQFKFNKAKADELRSQGNIEAAIKYENANTDLIYKTGSLAAEHERNAMMAPYYAANADYLRSGKGKNPDELTADQAGKNFAAAIKNPETKRQLAALGVTDALKYRQYWNTRTPPLNVNDTIPQGAQTLKLN
jgi:hypothetical protein